MKHITRICTFLLVLGCCTSCREQVKHDLPGANTQFAAEGIKVSTGPEKITRTLAQDKNGNIWMAAFDGVFRYDGSTFTNLTKDVSTSRFFSVLEDSKGMMWLGTIGSGVYRYDGKDWQNFTTNNGLVNNEIVSIFEDKSGNIWFGANGGVSRYDGSSFQNYLVRGDTIVKAKFGDTVPNLKRPPHEINAIIQDKTGKFWLATRGYTFIYDGKSFDTVTHDDVPFSNVRTLIEDRMSSIWLGGADGLWRYDGSRFTRITQNFVGYLYEAQNGDVWTSSQRAIDQKWILSRYEVKSLSNKQPAVVEIASAYDGNQGMIFGIMESATGTIWLGALDGIYVYNGGAITKFSGKE